MKTLDFNEMENVNGGVSQLEYCSTLDMLQHYNWDTWSDAERLSFGYAWEAYCTNLR